VSVVPGAGAGIGYDGEGAAVVRQGIIIIEVVDQLLYADRILGRQLSVIEKAADVGVGGRVDVDGEGGQRVLGDLQKAVLVDPGVLLGVVVRREVITAGLVAD
jgi:hypothetical protein